LRKTNPAVAGLLGQITRIDFLEKIDSSELRGVSIYQPSIAAGRSGFPRFTGFYWGFLESNVSTVA
jgi:hypothetical protein